MHDVYCLIFQNIKGTIISLINLVLSELDASRTTDPKSNIDSGSHRKTHRNY